MSGEGGYLPIDEKKNKWSKKVIPTGSTRRAHSMTVSMRVTVLPAAAWNARNEYGS